MRGARPVPASPNPTRLESSRLRTGTSAVRVTRRSSPRAFTERRRSGRRHTDVERGGIMTTCTIEIPPSLGSAVAGRRGEPDLPRWGLEALVTSAVGEGLISTGQAAELLGLGYFQTLALLKAKRVPHPGTTDDLRRDREDLAAMFPDTARR